MRTDLLTRLFRAENYDPPAPVFVRPPLKSGAPEPELADARTASYLAEYAELAETLGVPAHNLDVESFKRFLAAHDITVFSLAEVISYMDKKAAEESKDKAGWEWRPLREKDNRADLHFGHKASRISTGRGVEVVSVAASDYYRGPYKGCRYNFGHEQDFEAGPSSRPYDKTVPLHALRKVGLIEKGFPGSVAFFVCDYAPAPHIQYPDPFLMAVVVNDKIANGTGRFIIDFWDEPGFGLDKQLT